MRYCKVPLEVFHTRVSAFDNKKQNKRFSKTLLRGFYAKGYRRNISRNKESKKQTGTGHYPDCQSTK